MRAGLGVRQHQYMEHTGLCIRRSERAPEELTSHRQGNKIKIFIPLPSALSPQIAPSTLRVNVFRGPAFYIKLRHELA